MSQEPVPPSFLIIYEKSINMSLMLLCWDIGTRTQNNRTRICCVANYTISQSRIASVKDALFLICGCKVNAFFCTDQILFDFFYLFAL